MSDETGSGLLSAFRRIVPKVLPTGGSKDDEPDSTDSPAMTTTADVDETEDVLEDDDPSFGEDDDLFECDETGCDFTSESELGVKIHKGQMHQALTDGDDEEVDTEEDSPIWCGVCGAGEFDSMSQLTGHHAGSNHDGATVPVYDRTELPDAALEEDGPDDRDDGNEDEMESDGPADEASDRSDEDLDTADESEADEDQDQDQDTVDVGLPDHSQEEPRSIKPASEIAYFPEDNWTVEEVQELAADLEYLADVAEEIGVSEGQCRAILVNINAYSEVREGGRR